MESRAVEQAELNRCLGPAQRFSLGFSVSPKVQCLSEKGRKCLRFLNIHNAKIKLQ